MASAIVNVAVLDDYQSLSAQFFDNIVPDRVKVTYFAETLNTRNDVGLAQAIERLKPFAVISSMRERTPFPRALLSELPDLKLLLTTGNRNASIDLEACKELGIEVAGTDPRHDLPKGKHIVPDSTTTHCWAMILGLSRHIARDDLVVKEGGWQGPTLATAIAGKTLALCGLGRLGTSCGRIGVLAWGMKVICWSSNLTQEKADEQAKSVGLEAGEFKVVTKEELFQKADVLSVHYVLSERSRGLVGTKELGLMKPSALLINTSRGPIIDEPALLQVCETGTIAGVGLDVFDLEPLPKDSDWRRKGWGQDGRSDVLLSPHMGYGETETIECWYKENSENLGRWLEGKELSARLIQ
ncbi:glycerate dehydrogenase [Venturia nashicola]|uniref:Glycerate dehydrogenase n=1 Tax=Venturia nashicola TaxID=86259 RepID=A0A4Z1NTN6_9PEZI|nr:glycerate dehydrogenase [Venturia nashicola]TLD24715.1 glycerate dehydrogenase [Venturia nashicola]